MCFGFFYKRMDKKHNDSGVIKVTLEPNNNIRGVDQVIQKPRRCGCVLL